MSVETDAWRLVEARRLIEEFREKFSDAASEDIQRNLAVFYMGSLSSVVSFMSDKMVADRMRNEVPY